MDYGFILCEELVEKKEYYEAFILLDLIIRMEQKIKYFKHFSVEVKELTRKILLHNIEKNIPDELALDCWERALELGFSNKDNQAFLKKISNACNRLENYSKKTA